MVFREDYQSSIKPESKPNLALPADRLTAVILDMAFLLPLVTVVLAPLQKEIYLHRILSEYWGVLVGYGISVLVVLVMGIVYQGWFWFRFSATPGQLLMGLRLRNTERSRLSLHQCVFRSMSWWLNWVLLGIPFLSVFSHVKRRPFHDRVAETEVIGVRKRCIGAPNLTEQILFSTLQSIGATFSVFFVLFSTSFFYNTFSSPSAVSQFFHGNSIGCELVAKNREQLLEDDPNTTRLSTAMALYASDELPLECLEKEAQNSLWDLGTEQPLAYLAMAFVKMDEPDLSNTYYDQVCSKHAESSSCQLSKLMTSFEKPRKNWAKLPLDTDGLNYPTQIWALRFANRMGHFERALDIINGLHVIPGLANFINEQRIRALSGLQRDDEGEIVLTVATDNLSFEPRNKLLAWHCHEQIQKDCSSLPKSCEILKINTAKNPDLLKDELSSLTVLRINECQGFNNWANSIDDSNSALRFVNALQKYKEDKNITPLRLLAFEQHSTPYVQEARVRLASLSSQWDDISHLTELWNLSREVGHIWDRQALILLDRSIELGEYDHSVELAESYLQQRPQRASAIDKFVAELKLSKTANQKKIRASLLKRAIRDRSPAGTFK